MPFPARASGRNRPAAALALMLAGTAMPALAQTPPAPLAGGCSAAGIDWLADPVFRRARHFSDAGRPMQNDVVCTVKQVADLAAGDTTLRLTLGRLNHEKADGVQLPVHLVEIARVTPQGVQSLARVLLDADPINRMDLFQPQVRQVGARILVRLAPRHDWLFAIAGDAVAGLPAFDWAKGAEAGGKPNQGGVISVDLERLEGRLALRQGGTDLESGKLPSAYEGNRMLVAKLGLSETGLVMQGSEVRPRQHGDDPVLDEFDDADLAAKRAAGTLPPGTEPCSLGAWSNDTDPAGLNVRAAPGLKAKVVGIVPPPRKLPPSEEAFGPEPLKSEFGVFGYRDGWFLIGKISAPGVAYDIRYPASAPQPYKGRGWVNAKMVGGALANGGLPMGEVFASPHADAARKVVKNAAGEPIGLDGTPFRLLACSGWWGLVEFPDGQRGWWRSICSNQATNCS